MARPSPLGGAPTHPEGLRWTLFCERIAGGEGREGAKPRGSSVPELFLPPALRLPGEFFGAGEPCPQLECGFSGQTEQDAPSVGASSRSLGLARARGWEIASGGSHDLASGAAGFTEAQRYSSLVRKESADSGHK